MGRSRTENKVVRGGTIRRLSCSATMVPFTAMFTMWGSSHRCRDVLRKLMRIMLI
jgi:hypothetical protein